MKKLFSILFMFVFLAPHSVIARSPSQQVDSLFKREISSKRKSIRNTSVRSQSENALKQVSVQQENDFSHPGYPNGNISMKKRVKKERRLIKDQEYSAKEKCRNSGQKLKQRKECIKRVNRLFNRKIARLESEPEQYFNGK